MISYIDRDVLIVMPPPHAFKAHSPEPDGEHESAVAPLLAQTTTAGTVNESPRDILVYRQLRPRSLPRTGGDRPALAQDLATEHDKAGIPTSRPPSPVSRTSMTRLRSTPRRRAIPAASSRLGRSIRSFGSFASLFSDDKDLAALATASLRRSRRGRERSQPRLLILPAMPSQQQLILRPF